MANGTVRPVLPVLVFQLSKQQNRTRTTSSIVLGTLGTVLGQRNSPQKSFEEVALLVGFSTGNPPKIGTFTAWTRSPPKGAGKKVPRENCRKVSKNFLTFFDDF